MGQEDRHDRQQRIVRNHPHDRRECASARRHREQFLPAGGGGRDRRDQRHRLRGQQRCIPHRLRPQPGSLQRGGGTSVRRPQYAGDAAR